jgi:D-serine deaminase-like pyridoxal phosphate-dependent protein
MIQPGTPIAELDTPCLLVDLDRLEANIRAWQAAISACGVALRPHVKTHKSPAIARMQLAAGAAGVTVAKVSEAEVFAAGGCRDIFIAYPLIGAEKWRRAAELARACALTVGADSETGVDGLSAAAVRAGTVLRVRVEVEIGLNRSGLPAGQAAGLCRRVMAAPGLELDGLYGFRGARFAGAAGRSDEELGLDEGRLLAGLADRLRAEGIPIRAVSLGSTPTARHVARVPGVTEVRPGTYVFGDIMSAACGAMAYDEVALSILCTVVSRPAADRATLDGGSKTFSGDIVPARLNLPGYARSLDGRIVVESLSEEHGVARLADGADPRIGDKIAFHPIHVCTTVNLSDELIGVRGGRVERIFPVLARGMRA